MDSNTIKQFRVGDYVKYGDSICQILSIVSPQPYPEKRYNKKAIFELNDIVHSTVPIDEISKIVLDDDILLQCGFDENTCVLSIDDNLFFGKDHEGNIRIGYADSWVSGPIEYLHELQNIYFELTKKEILLNKD